MAELVVIGGGLAGMAAAARLAKARHHVVLLEQRDRLGGAWAARDLDGIPVDAAPPIFSFPAPWRDLFRKSGRSLEAEFARSGDELVPAPPTRHLFADGTEFVLPIGRGDQDEAIATRFGRPVADRWRDLVDSLGEVWQTLRPLGIEAELSGRDQLPRMVRKTLLHKQSLADVADCLDHPQLSMIIRDLGHPAGGPPERVPAFCAVQLYLDRTFGRWTAGSGTTMINSLQQRLSLRKVEVRLQTPATAIETDPLAVIADDRLAADAVIATCDADQLYHRLLPGRTARKERRRLERLPEALAPSIEVRWDDAGLPARGEPTETIRHTAGVGPRIEYTRPVDGRTLRIVHDYTEPRTDPTAGLGWRGFAGWLKRPPISSELTGLYTAGPFSRGGPAPSMQVLSGALAAYASQRLVAPDRPLEPR
ncbi:FAD-dependent oxidoreductase [Microlunatus elymi]|uniref:FAD-dependent oxidoreductase n=1 Tax=Microlunatus elymi TaxID=2596828 RepID=A0A516Q2I9_9ACTN|nr:NAD(P)-binding protein [Microlunatus elymi]QDP97602.1 FAD-dependent oxidoreductase [Microlunatus elymi]